MIVRSATLLALGLLAACDSGGNGTTISFEGNESGERITARADGETGRVAIDTPGFKADIKLPRIELDSENLDINGVKLFPGSTVEGVEIIEDGSGPDYGTVRIRFSAPGNARAVRDWFDQRMRAEGFTLDAGGAGLSGTTNEDEPFRLDLAPEGETTRGTFTLGS